MPSLSYQVPKSVWARFEQEAARDGVNVRTWILWKLKALATEADAVTDDKPKPELESAA